MLDFNNLPAKDKLYYLDAESGIAIYCADCREILPLFPDKSFDLVLTDPPYGVELGVKKNNQRFDRLQYISFEDKPDIVLELVLSLFKEFHRLGIRIVITPGVNLLFSFPKPTHTGSFYYPAANGCNSWGFSNWQPILFYGKDPYLANGMGSKHDSFQSVESAPKNGHPCPKPINQWLWLVGRTSISTETILDPFLGSGTTAVCAKKLGRKCVGIEISEEYCAIAVKRLSQSVMQFNEPQNNNTEQKSLI